MKAATRSALKVGLRAFGFGGALLATEAACSLVIDTGGLAGERAETEVTPREDGGEATDAFSNDAGGRDAASPGAGADADADATTPACPGDAGPAGVRVDDYCIDATEVTNADYAQFVQANVGPGGQPAGCAWNVSYVPNEAWPPSANAMNRPVVSVDWCDAWAYCAWAGKRLCGAVGGGPIAAGALADSARDQWYRACSGRGSSVRPYGDAYEADRCNVAASGGTREVVMSRPGCVGGVAGLYDMLGNVNEWVDSCTGDGGADDSCYVRESFYASGEGVTCATVGTRARSSWHVGRGFRCCAP